MPKDKTYLLTINGGSSSIKFTLYNVTESLTSILSGKLTGLGLPTAKLRVTNSIQAEESVVDIKADNYQQAVEVLIDWVYKNIDISSVKALSLIHI